MYRNAVSMASTARSTVAHSVLRGADISKRAHLAARESDARCVLVGLRECSRQIERIRAITQSSGQDRWALVVRERARALAADAGQLRSDLRQWDVVDSPLSLEDLHVRLGKLESELAHLHRVELRWLSESSPAVQRRAKNPKVTHLAEDVESRVYAYLYQGAWAVAGAGAGGDELAP